jgi:hypothetical protein
MVPDNVSHVYIIIICMYIFRGQTARAISAVAVACPAPRGPREVNLIRVIFLAFTRVREALRSRRRRRRRCGRGAVRSADIARRSGNIFHDYRPAIRR